MKLKLLAPHMVPMGAAGDRWCPAGTILEEAPPGYMPTPMMEGLDDEGREAVAYMKLAVWGRYPWPHGLLPPAGAPLDDPPIPRPLDDNQPVYWFSGRPEYL